MKSMWLLTKRNIKLFFSDKALFLTALITPVILLVLYVTFLRQLYMDTYTQVIRDGFNASVSDGVLSGLVGGQLVSSLLSVMCITVSVSSNMLMVQDKYTGMTADMGVSPVKKHIMPISYYIATVFVTMVIALVTLCGCFIYIAAVGWYLSLVDILMILLDTFLLVMLGTAFSSVINFFLSSQGQISAVGSTISSCYGFISGAYMPLSQFPEWLQRVVSFLPGTYGTALLREHSMRGSLDAMSDEGLGEEVISALRESADCAIYFFDTKVEVWQSYLIICGAIILLLGIYIGLNYLSLGKKRTT